MDSNCNTKSGNRLSNSDLRYMSLALRHASIGKGGTYPNPAVGCVLVKTHHDDAPPSTDDDDAPDGRDSVIGQGFHPAAGMPHAEIFALLEACGHVDDGIEAAKSVMIARASSEDKNGNELRHTVKQLLETYASENGASKLFGNAFTSDTDDDDGGKVTAYVTLEPCCHYGQTPPCALALKDAGVSRVVVGHRDPNPRVDGGGVKLLREAGVQVDIVDNGTIEGSKVANQCADIVSCFAKRIAPRSDGDIDYDVLINGAKRRGLRALKERMVSEGTMAEISWPNRGSFLDTSDESANLHDLVRELQIEARWMEQLDEALWRNELVLMRLGNAIKGSKKNASAGNNINADSIADELVLAKLGSAVSKKRGVKVVANRIASELGAHVAQVKGHTALLYRPGLPPILDLDELVAGKEGDK